MSDLAAFMKGRARIAGLPETREVIDRYHNATNGGRHEVLARHSLNKSPAPSSTCASTIGFTATSSRRACCLTCLQPTCSNTRSWRRFFATVPSCGTASDPQSCSPLPISSTHYFLFLPTTSGKRLERQRRRRPTVPASSW
jgi:hypothetical protein